MAELKEAVMRLRRALAPPSTTILAVLLTTGLLALAACGGSAEGTELRSTAARQPVSLSQAPAVPSIVRASDDLGVDLLAQTPEPNAVTSPASAAIALGMLAEGVDGSATTELTDLLGAGGHDRSQALNALTASLAPLDGDPAVVRADDLPDTPVVHVANNVVIDDEAEILPTYLDRLATTFDAGLTQTDLGSDAGTEVLDAWVAEHSGGLIEKSAVQPDPLLRVVLQNAVTLAARWDAPFEPNLTHDADFTLTSGEVVQVPTMAARRSWRYAELDGWQAVRLPYTGGQLHADVVLPPEGTAVGDLDGARIAALEEALGQARGTDVELTLPKVDLRTTTELLPLLQERTPAITQPGALGGVSSAEDLVLSAAVQQAVLTIDEEGTVAAAVTELGMAGTSAPPPDKVEMHVDRPYVIRIGHGETGWALFLARIGDPRG